jgi:hypothetical protein
VLCVGVPLLYSAAEVDTHLKLLQQHESNGMREQRMEQLLWLIENRPESQVHQRYPRSTQEPTPDFARIWAAWTKQAERHPGSAAVFGNAGYSLIFQDPEMGEQFLKKARALEPANRRWGLALALLYAGLVNANELSPIAGFPNKPEMVRRIQQELAASNDALVVGLVGRALGKSEAGKQFVNRARTLDPLNPKWKAGAEAGGNPPTRIRFARLLRMVEPEYPPLARHVRTQGTVRFDVTTADSAERAARGSCHTS